MLAKVDFAASDCYYRRELNVQVEPYMPPFRQIEFLYAGLERPRCLFVDGILETLLRSRRITLARNESEVDHHVAGLSGTAWRLLRRVYRNRLEPGLTTRATRKLWLRRGWSPRGRLLRLLRRDLRRVYLEHDRPLVVDHAVLPLLIRAGGGIVYNHGELAFGIENAATAADWVLVPTPEVADRYVQAGFHADRIVVTGLCIEPSLVPQAMTAFEQRISRLEDGAIVSGGIFMDESEPAQQVRSVVEGVLSACRQHMGRLFVFCRDGGPMAQRLEGVLARYRIPCGHVDGSRGIGSELHPVVLVQTRNRREEVGLVARLFPELDYIVAPPREKLLWAAGLGVPVIWLRRGRNDVERHTEELGRELKVARSVYAGPGRALLGPLVTMLRESGQLNQMARAGWGKRPIDGFANSVEFLANICEKPSL
jgi:hypothetical protein